MGYLNNVLGYRDDLLASRSIVYGNYALPTPDGLVKNVILICRTLRCDYFGTLSTPK